MVHTSNGSLTGIIVPMVTPLMDDDRCMLDIGGLERLVEHLIDGGVDGIFVLGTTGEAAHLDCPLRIELIKRTCCLTAGRVPIVVGIADTVWNRSRMLAEAAANANATAVVLAPPYYYPLLQDELLRYFELASTELPLPLVLYNIPQLTKTAIEIATVGQLQQIESILGIKDSSGAVGYFKQLLELGKSRPNWSVLMGSELLLADALAAGAHGGVPGGGNLLPALFAELYTAILAGKTTTAAACQTQIARLNRIYDADRSAAAVIRTVKAGLSHLGVCSTTVARPFEQMQNESLNDLYGWLSEFQVARDQPA